MVGFNLILSIFLRETPHLFRLGPLFTTILYYINLVNRLPIQCNTNQDCLLADKSRSIQS